MFGADQLALMQEMQKKLEESKQRLAEATIEGEAGSGLVRVVLAGNRQLKKLEINTDLKEMEKEDLEDLLVVAMNRAMEKADQLNEREMAQSAMSFMPNLPKF